MYVLVSFCIQIATEMKVDICELYAVGQRVRGLRQQKCVDGRGILLATVLMCLIIHTNLTNM